ncbi:protein of unknown function [Bradyrhizobium vignae]|uniref:Uncharacterized protein n=1 Tax=Bradyrhizobium vignae TaxID=1549949 RepID=A0A2U3PV96_9BRAD|nr:protein of unknown function [Bradyrhizobium vignae]
MSRVTSQWLTVSDRLWLGNPTPNRSGSNNDVVAAREAFGMTQMGHPRENRSVY